MSDSITFLASIPPIMSALKVSGNGDGMRLQLDIPESEMAQGAYLLAMRECVLEVTIRRADDDRKQQPGDRKSTY